MGPALRVGYVRVSTASGEQLAALESQRARIEAAGVDEVIEDVQSGRESDRAGYLRLLDLIDRRQVREVVITRVDRLGRDAADTDAAIAFAAKRGVLLTALDGGAIESETPQGFVMSRIMTTMAEMESRMLSLRIKGGLAQRRLEGRPLRGRAPWGYRITADKRHFEPHPLEWGRAQQFLALMREGGWRMNPALDRWAAEGRGEIPLHSCRAVRAWLLNPVLRGATGYRQQKNHRFAEVVWGTHPALIDEAVYDEIKAALAQNRRMWGHNAYTVPRLLTSLCRCGHCGHSMPYAPGRRIPAVLCRTRGCLQEYRSTREELVRQAVNEALSSRAHALAAAVAIEPPELEQLRHEIAELQSRADPDLKEAIERKLSRLHNLHKTEALDPQLVAELSRPKFWAHYSPEELRELYQGLVQRVVIRDQQVAEVGLRY